MLKMITTKNILIIIANTYVMQTLLSVICTYYPNDSTKESYNY